MKTAAADFKSWWDKHEAAYQISKRTGTAFDAANLLQVALDQGVRFVVNVPTGTKDVQGRAMPGGLWELMIGGKFGKPGRQEIECEINPTVSRSNKGAWVGRPGVEQRQLRPRGWPNSRSGALPDGCVLGLRRQVVEGLAETMNKELAKKERRQVVESVIEGGALPTPDALDKPLGERERATLLVIIGALAEKAKIDVSHPTTAAKSIMRLVELLGAKLSRQAIERKLKLVPDAVEKNKILKR